VKVGYLGDQLKVFGDLRRTHYRTDGQKPAPNCGTCAYRTCKSSRWIPAKTVTILTEDRETTRRSLRGFPTADLRAAKYRTQVLGFKSEVGAVQESHHHHVEGPRRVSSDQTSLPYAVRHLHRQHVPPVSSTSPIVSPIMETTFHDHMLH
jgi:hypothetical protein